MKQLLIGFFGQGNLGDDAMLLGFLNASSGWERTIFLMCSRLPLSLPYKVGKIIHSPRKISSFAQALFESDQVVMVGGTHFHDLNGNKRYIKVMLIFWLISALTIITGKNLIFLCIGVGPLKTWWGKFITRSLLKLGSQVIVRDQDSLKCVESLGVSANKCFDLAVLMKSSYSKSESRILESSISNATYTLGISVMPAFKSYYGIAEKDDALIRSFAQSLANFIKSVNVNLCIRLFGFRSDKSLDSDQGVSIRIMDILSQLVDIKSVDVKYIPYSNDPLSFLTKVSECNSMIGMRYHSCLLSFLYNIPTIYISYHPKNMALASEVGMQSGAVISLEDVINGSLDNRLKLLYESPELFQASLSLDKAAKEALSGVEVCMNSLKLSKI